MKLLAASRVRRSPDIAFRTIGEETWIISTQDSALHRLNDTGAFLWDHLSEEPTLRHLAAGLTQTFEVAADQAMADTLTFVGKLADQGLVVLLPPAE